VPFHQSCSGLDELWSGTDGVSGVATDIGLEPPPGFVWHGVASGLGCLQGGWEVPAIGQSRIGHRLRQPKCVFARCLRQINTNQPARERQATGTSRQAAGPRKPAGFIAAGKRGSREGVSLRRPNCLTLSRPGVVLIGVPGTSDRPAGVPRDLRPAFFVVCARRVGPAGRCRSGHGVVA
jgi:hypothetical protein